LPGETRIWDAGLSSWPTAGCGEEMYEILVEASFSAIHAVRLPDGRVEPKHGHDWVVVVCLGCDELDEYGFVADFEDVQEVLQGHAGELHHCDLNQHRYLAGVSPTAENVAKVLYDLMRASELWGRLVRSVAVTEAPGCVARFEGKLEVVQKPGAS
jgi:6-pyruvoyltetrahydropterin/6-carboxytetrahydropterin synthase